MTRPIEEAKATWLALQATGMDRFEAIVHVTRGDQPVAAHLWMEALRLIDVPAGSFLMGGKGRLREIVVENPFRLGSLLVTQGAWASLMKGNPSYFQGDPNRPVEKVSWKDLRRQNGFLERLNRATEGARPDGWVFRLPSEAEWECACRAGTMTVWPFGDNGGELDRHGWCGANAQGRTHPVGLKDPNPWGFWDMHGNVMEWCEDTWHPSLEGAPSCAKAWVEGGHPDRHVVRGGSYAHDEACAEPSARHGIASDAKDMFFGCRLALGLPHENRKPSL